MDVRPHSAVRAVLLGVTSTALFCVIALSIPSVREEETSLRTGWQSLLLAESGEQESAEPEVDVYFGAGCFWHVQHAFIVAETKYLHRDWTQATARTGYAGSTRTGPGGKVCYHNAENDSDYGALGHSEAVSVHLPVNKLQTFFGVFFNLFKNGERGDPQDRGSEYRSMLGLPGGVNSPYFHLAQDAATKHGMKLEEGKGGDPDTLGTRVVYVYDTAQFPFHVAEMYHQYHDDMVEKYGSAYHQLRQEQESAGKLAPTGCPEKQSSFLDINSFI